MFNDIWYDFDEEKGVINKPKYLQVMNFVCQYKKIKKKEDGPFSDKRLEEDWDNEINTLYEDEDKQWFDRISHKDVLHITHNNLFDEKQRKMEKFKRKQELLQARQEVMALRAQ